MSASRFLAAVAALALASVPAQAEKLAAPAPAAKPHSAPGCAAPCQPLPLVRNHELNISGSTTVRPITERAQTFFQVDQNVDFTVLAGGSGAGRRSLLEGQCARVGGFASCDLNGDAIIDPPTDIAASSSKAPASEFTFAAAHGCCLVEYSVAIDGLGIIVNTTNTLGNLNRNQIAQIYTNPAVNNYAAVLGTPGPIHVYSRRPPSGTFDSFLALYITPETPAPLLPSCGPMPGISCITFLDSNDQIAAAVAADPQGIGYVGVGFLSASTSIRSLPVRRTAADPAVAASFASVQDGTFAFSRKLYYYTCGVPSVDDLRGEFIDFVMARTGQAIVASTGFVPSYLINPVAANEQALLEPSIERVLDIDADRIAETLARLATLDPVADANLIAELRSFLHEQFLGDRAIVGNVVNRAVACGADAARAAQAQAAFDAAVAAATAPTPDFATANTLMQQALRLAQQSLR